MNCLMLLHYTVSCWIFDNLMPFFNYLSRYIHGNMSSFEWISFAIIANDINEAISECLYMICYWSKVLQITFWSSHYKLTICLHNTWKNCQHFSFPNPDVSSWEESSVMTRQHTYPGFARWKVRLIQNIYDKVLYEFKERVSPAKITRHGLDPSQIQVWKFLRPNPTPIMVKFAYMC